MRVDQHVRGRARTGVIVSRLPSNPSRPRRPRACRSRRSDRQAWPSRRNVRRSRRSERGDMKGRSRSATKRCRPPPINVPVCFGQRAESSIEIDQIGEAARIRSTPRSRRRCRRPRPSPPDRKDSPRAFCGPAAPNRSSRAGNGRLRPGCPWSPTTDSPAGGSQTAQSSPMPISSDGPAFTATGSASRSAAMSPNSPMSRTVAPVIASHHGKPPPSPSPSRAR